MNRLTFAVILSVIPVMGFAQSSHVMNHDAPVVATGMIPATEPGQGAFAAIGEIVMALEADPATDWSKVNIKGLREHLRDMALVTIDAAVQAEIIDGGMKFTVTGSAEVAPSITRMVLAHAGIMQGVNHWHYQATALRDGAVVTVMVPHHDRAKLKALGFFGMLTSGMHHQAHHWMMATDANPHE